MEIGNTISPDTGQLNTAEQDRYHVPNLERALAMLELLAAMPDGAGLAEISERMSYPKNSVYRIISTLHARGYLLRDETRKTYQLSRKLLTLGYAALGEANLIEIALDTMRTVRDLTGETTLLGVLAGVEGVVLEQAPSRQMIKFLVEPGMRFPLHTSAPGKAILAALPEHELQPLLSRLPFIRFNERTITDPQMLLAELARIRERGYSTDHAEEIDGLSCVGAALLNHCRYPVAGLWVTGPSFRFPEAEFHRMGAVVAEHARRLSTRLGCPAPL